MTPQDAWTKGYQGFCDDLSLDSNPFEEGSDSYSEWWLGWYASYDDYEYSLQQEV